MTIWNYGHAMRASYRWGVSEVVAFCHGWDHGRLPEDSGAALPYRPQNYAEILAYNSGKSAAARCGGFASLSQKAEQARLQTDYAMLNAMKAWHHQREHPDDCAVARRAHEAMDVVWEKLGDALYERYVDILARRNQPFPTQISVRNPPWW